MTRARRIGGVLDQPSNAACRAATAASTSAVVAEVQLARDGAGGRVEDRLACGARAGHAAAADEVADVCAIVEGLHDVHLK